MLISEFVNMSISEHELSDNEHMDMSISEYEPSEYVSI